MAAVGSLMILLLSQLTLVSGYYEVIGKNPVARSFPRWHNWINWIQIPDSGEHIQVNGTVVGYRGYIDEASYSFRAMVFRPFSMAANNNRYTLVGQTSLFTPRYHGYVEGEIHVTPNITVSKHDIIGFQIGTSPGGFTSTTLSNCTDSMYMRAENIPNPCVGCDYNFTTSVSCHNVSFQLVIQSPVDPNGVPDPPPPAPILSPALYIPLNGTAWTVDSSNIVPVCEQEFERRFTTSSQTVVSKAQLLIDIGALCNSAHDAKLQLRTSDCIAQGNKLNLFLEIDLPSNDLTTLEQMEYCVPEIVDYITNMTHWPEPIIPDVPQCPSLYFSPMYFTGGSSGWCHPESILPKSPAKFMKTKASPPAEKAVGTYQQWIGHSPIHRDERDITNVSQSNIADPAQAILVNGTAIGWRAFFVLTTGTPSIPVAIKFQLWRPHPTMDNSYLLLDETSLMSIDDVRQQQGLFDPSDQMQVERGDRIGFYVEGNEHGVPFPFNYVSPEDCYQVRQFKQLIVPGNLTVGNYYSFTSGPCREYSYEVIIESAVRPDGSPAPPPNVLEAPPLTLLMNGTAFSTTGEVISGGCAAYCENEFTVSAQTVTSQVNARIRSGIMCVGRTRMSAILRGTAAIPEGHLLHTSINLEIAAQRDVTILGMELCANEIAAYIGELKNWVEPVIPDTAGCPPVAFNTTILDKGILEWCK